MEIEIKELNEDEDILQFSTVLSVFFAEIEHIMSESGDMISLIKDFLSSGFIALALCNNEIIGFISIIESKALYAGGKYGVINELYVKSNYRSNGIGTKLIGYAQELKEKKNWTRLELSTPDELKWSRTVAFYEKIGFKKIGLKMKRSGNALLT